MAVLVDRRAKVAPQALRRSSVDSSIAQFLMGDRLRIEGNPAHLGSVRFIPDSRGAAKTPVEAPQNKCAEPGKTLRQWQTRTCRGDTGRGDTSLQARITSGGGRLPIHGPDAGGFLPPRCYGIAPFTKSLLAPPPAEARQPHRSSTRILPCPDAFRFFCSAPSA